MPIFYSPHDILGTPEITDIEKETFHAIAHGKTYKEIAHERNVSESAVKATCNRVHNRLGLTNNLAVLRELVVRNILLFPFGASNGLVLTQKEKETLIFLSKGYKQSQSQKILGITTSGLKFRLGDIRKKYQVSTNEAALVEAILRGDIRKEESI